MPISIEMDVTFDATGSRDLHCDIFHPGASATPTAAAILLMRRRIAAPPLASPA